MFTQCSSQQVHTPEKEKESTWYKTFKREVYHTVLSHLFESVWAISHVGEAITCADGVVRRVYPGVHMLSMDYEEQ